MTLDFSILSIDLFLLATALIAGLVDTLAGGGGLLTLPALLISGVPPLASLGTNKLQGSVGTAMATYMMFRHKRISWQSVKYFMLLSFTGSAIGAVIVQWIDVQFLSYIIPLVLFIIVVYFIIAPTSHETDHTPRISEKLFQNGVVPIIGCYDGMFGPGTGSFFSSGNAFFRGMGFVKATAYAKALNFSSNIAAFIVFMFAGQLVWKAALVMMLGQIIGAWIGSHCLIKIKPLYLRIMVVIMSLSMLIKYMFS